MLISRKNSLEVQRFDGSNPPIPTPPHWDEFSTNGAYVVTGCKDGQTVTITNLGSQTSSKAISVGLEAQGLVLINDIILVVGRDRLAAWQLMAEGAVDQILGDIVKENSGEELWTMPGRLERFWSEGYIGVRTNRRIHYYNVKTGPLQPSIKAPPPSAGHSMGLVYDERGSFGNNCSSVLGCHDFVECDDPSKESAPVSIPRYKGGWVKYPGGDHQRRFWLPAHWRPKWKEAHWLDNVTTLRLKTASSELAIIKF